MVNKWIGIGRVGKTPETRYLADGTAVCNFSLACTEKHKDKQGNAKEETFWASCVAWSRLAEIIQEYVDKGSLLYVEGKLKQRSWNKDGVKRYATDVVISEMKMLSPKSGGHGGGQEQDPLPDQPEMGSDCPF